MSKTLKIARFEQKIKANSLDQLNSFTNINQLWKDVTKCPLNKYNRIIDFDVYLPKYQTNLQRDLVWSEYQSSELILSILYDRYIPPITIIQLCVTEFSSRDSTYQIIDGKQRLTAMVNFRNGSIPIMLDGEFYWWSDCDEKIQNKINSFTILAKHYISYGKDSADKDFISDDAKIEIFQRVNFIGTQQDENHIKNILNQGKYQ
jgi:hypothetical protein